MKSALRVSQFGLARDNQDTNTRKFGGEIFDPADGITVFEKGFDEQQIGAMLSNKFIRLLKSVCGTANLVPRVAANNCDQALLANYSIADRHDPVWRRICASWGALFHGYTVLTNQPAGLQALNLRFLRNLLPPPFFSGNRGAAFLKVFNNWKVCAHCPEAAELTNIPADASFWPFVSIF